MSPGPVVVQPVESGRDLAEFIALPKRLYRGQKGYVAPLDLERKEILSRRKNPYFQHAEGELFVARRAGEVVGRISAQFCRLHQEKYRDDTGHFGWVDTIDDLSVWVDSSAYVGTFTRGRDVPDVCGIAASMMLPAGVTATHPEGWRDKEGATSAATAQVAGVAALLMQKDPTRTPAQIRALMKNEATDIVLGATASGVGAHGGPDLATGAGLVNALDAWNAI